MDYYGSCPAGSRCLPESIPSTGLSVVYQPDTDDPVVDIIMVHGLSGHPYKTWRFQPSDCDENQSSHTRQEISKPRRSRRLELIQTIQALVKRPSRTKLEEKDNRSIFWPADLLPDVCKNARILTFGYDTKVTKYASGPANMNSIFSHGKDFLCVLGRERAEDRRLIFIAHSLGGILVKEMLSLSSTSGTLAHKKIVECTSAIIFLGTPHRGSPELAEIGEAARSLLSSLHFQTTAAILDILRLKTSDLRRSQEAFSGLWQEHDFRVKTFQEGFGLTKIDLGILGNKVVPDTSSEIGDIREHTETLQANHMEMCRFSGFRDPNYIKVAGEIHKIYTAIESTRNPCYHMAERTEVPEMSRDHDVMPNSSNPVLDTVGGMREIIKLEKFDTLIKSLRFEGMDSRQENISPPAQNTGQWLYQNPTYDTWLSSHYPSQRILVIKGKPGAGKSTLMKQAVRKMKSHSDGSICASFFVNARGQPLEHSPCGVFRSVLCQILPYGKRCIPQQSKAARVLMQSLPDHKTLRSKDWSEQELQSLLSEVLEVLSSNHVPVFVFVDALDELGKKGESRQVEFWGDFSTLQITLT